MNVQQTKLPTAQTFQTKSKRLGQTAPSLIKILILIIADWLVPAAEQVQSAVLLAAVLVVLAEALVVLAAQAVQVPDKVLSADTAK